MDTSCDALGWVSSLGGGGSGSRKGFPAAVSGQFLRFANRELRRLIDLWIESPILFVDNVRFNGKLRVDKLGVDKLAVDCDKLVVGKLAMLVSDDGDV